MGGHSASWAQAAIATENLSETGEMQVSLSKRKSQSLEQGREEGSERTLVANLSSLMTSTGWDIEQAMEKLGIPIGDRQKMESLMEELSC